MYPSKTEEQLNRKTKGVKNMGVFTTNWYLYKTHFHTISTDSQTQRPRNRTEVYGSREESNISIRKWRSSIKQ